MNLKSTEEFYYRVFLLINNNNNPESWWSGLEGFCIFSRICSLETQGSFDQDFFHDCEDAFPAERWGNTLLDPLPTPHSIYFFNFFLNKWVQFHELWLQVKMQRCRSQWHIYHSALGSLNSRLAGNMGSCSKHPDPGINRNNCHKPSVMQSRNQDPERHQGPGKQHQGWDRARQDRPGKTSSKRDICCTMGQEEKGHVTFTEPSANTIGGKKSCFQSIENKSIKEIICFGRIPALKKPMKSSPFMCMSFLYT